MYYLYYDRMYYLLGGYMNTLEYCELLMKEGHAKSWYGLHKLLRVSQPTPLRWKNDGGTFDDETAIKVAKILEMPEEYVLADMAIERCKSPKAIRAWKRLLSRANPLLTSCVLSVYILCKIIFPSRNKYTLSNTRFI